MGQKTEFVGALADLTELTPQTAYALTTSPRAYAVVIDDLLRLISL